MSLLVICCGIAITVWAKLIFLNLYCPNRQSANQEQCLPYRFDGLGNAPHLPQSRKPATDSTGLGTSRRRVRILCDSDRRCI